jgi:hypothetical protein
LNDSADQIEASADEQNTTVQIGESIASTNSVGGGYKFALRDAEKEFAINAVEV